jgi:hypothetical protein
MAWRVSDGLQFPSKGFLDWYSIVHRIFWKTQKCFDVWYIWRERNCRILRIVTQVNREKTPLATCLSISQMIWLAGWGEGINRNHFAKCSSHLWAQYCSPSNLLVVYNTRSIIKPTRLFTSCSSSSQNYTSPWIQEIKL